MLKQERHNKRWQRLFSIRKRCANVRLERHISRFDKQPRDSDGVETMILRSLLTVSCHSIRSCNKFAHLEQSQFFTIRTMTSSKKALLVITDGAEEMETVITADVLRRAQIQVTLAGLNTCNPVKMSRGVVIVPDKNLDDVDAKTYDALVLPGGLAAAKAFCESAQIGTLLKTFLEENKLVAIICASPTALASHSVAWGRRVTCHPSMGDKLKAKYNYSTDRVVIDDNLITSQGPGTTFEFALAIVAHQLGQAKVQEISPPMILK